ncbi:MAG: protein kinase [Ignavibacteriales bacterium]|nr:protein kinase [Ignavibacteriales bacterium]
MGSVYRAVDENLGVDVAVKENLFTTDEYARQFRLEAVILANLRHPNLPRVTDHFVIGDQGQYLVMDYIEGEDLRQRMERQGNITEDEAILLGAAICDALHLSPHPQASDSAPRHQTGQCQDHARRAHLPGGLWSCQSAARKPGDHHRRARHDARIFASRTIRHRPHRSAHRYLLPGRHTLRLAERHHPRKTALRAPWTIHNSRPCANATARSRAGLRRRSKRPWASTRLTASRPRRSSSAPCSVPNPRPSACLENMSSSLLPSMRMHLSKQSSLESEPKPRSAPMREEVALGGTAGLQTAKKTSGRNASCLPCF